MIFLFIFYQSSDRPEYHMDGWLFSLTLIMHSRLYDLSV